MAHLQVGYLTGGSGDIVLLARRTGCRVEQRTQPIGGIMNLFEDHLVEFEAVSGRFGETVADRPGRVCLG
jgi:hypothetical protein